MGKQNKLAKNQPTMRSGRSGRTSLLVVFWLVDLFPRSPAQSRRVSFQCSRARGAARARGDPQDRSSILLPVVVKIPMGFRMRGSLGGNCRSVKGRKSVISGVWAAPGAPGAPSKRLGASPPTFCKGLRGPRGRTDPQNGRFPILKQFYNFISIQSSATKCAFQDTQRDPEVLLGPSGF